MHYTFRRVSYCQDVDKVFGIIIFLIRDLVAELPFILMHPKPDDIDDNILINENSSPNNNNNNGKSRNSLGDNQHAANNNSSAAKDDAPNLIQLDG